MKIRTSSNDLALCPDSGPKRAEVFRAVLHSIFLLLVSSTAAPGLAQVTNTGLILKLRESLHSNINAAPLKDKLQQLGPKPGMSLEEMIKLLEIDSDKLNFDDLGLSGDTLFWIRPQDEGIEISLTKKRRDPSDLAAEGNLKDVTIYDRRYSRALVTWTPTGGLQVPEEAKPDDAARFLLDQPIAPSADPRDRSWFPGELGQRAEKWHDERVALWNLRLNSLGGKPKFLPAKEEEGLMEGTYLVRVPDAYRNNSSWGLLVHVAYDAGPYLPLKLRKACDQHKLLYVGLQPSRERLGHHWGNAVYILRCIEKLASQFKFSANRTMLAADDCVMSALFAGLMHPESFNAVVSLGPQAVPNEVSSEYMNENGPIPLDWMETGDWTRNRLLRQHIGMTVSQPLTHPFLTISELRDSWKSTGLRFHALPGYSGSKSERNEPRRSVLAELTDAIMQSP